MLGCGSVNRVKDQLSGLVVTSSCAKAVHCSRSLGFGSVCVPHPFVSAGRTAHANHTAALQHKTTGLLTSPVHLTENTHHCPCVNTTGSTHHVCSHKADHACIWVRSWVLHNHVAAPLNKCDMLDAKGPSMLFT